MFSRPFGLTGFQRCFERNGEGKRGGLKEMLESSANMSLLRETVIAIEQTEEEASEKISFK